MTEDKTKSKFSNYVNTKTSDNKLNPFKKNLNPLKGSIPEPKNDLPDLDSSLTKNQHYRGDNTVRNMYIISKNINDDDMRKIRENFEDPSEYLNLNSKIVVGILPFKSKKEIQKSNMLYQKINESNAYNKSDFTNREKSPTETTAKKIQKQLLDSTNINNLDREHNNKLFPRPLSVARRPLTSKTVYRKINDSNNSCNCSIHYQLKTKNELDEKFKESKLREKESKIKGTDNLISTIAENTIKQKYIKQEKLLDRNRKVRLQSAKLSKGISKLCNKNENELLMNRIEEYRLRKQMVNAQEDCKTLNEIYGNNYWLCSLRRPSELDFQRVNYLNYGPKEKEKWDIIVEKPYQKVEFISNPESIIQNQYGNLINLDYFNYIAKKHKCKIPDMSGINTLKINGKNLADEEYSRVKNYFDMSKQEAKIRMYNNPKENIPGAMDSMTIKENYGDKRKGIKRYYKNK